MNTIPQITIADPSTRMPACRSASPKKRNTRPLKTSPKTCPQNLTITPRFASRSLGTVSQPVIEAPGPVGALALPAVAEELDHRAEVPLGEPLGRVAVGEIRGVGERIDLRVLAADEVSVLVVEPRRQDPDRP